MPKFFGRKPVLELLKSNQDILKIYFQRGVKGDVIDELKGIVIRQKLPWQELHQDKFKKLAGEGNHQGVVALTPEKRLIDEDECLELLSKRQDDVIILLDSIQDTHNLGAILRTAECAGVKMVITTKFNSAPLNETVSKVSAGALNHLQICAVRNLAEYIKKLKEIGYWIGASSLDESRDYSELDYSGKIAFIMGNEEKGVRRLLLQMSDFRVKIPMRGKIQSLNVSVAAGILLFEIMKNKSAGRQRTD